MIGRSCLAVGPWAKALNVLSFVGLAFNLAYLGITSDFFHQLSKSAPLFNATWPRVIALFAAEHLLLGLKVRRERSFSEPVSRLLAPSLTFSFSVLLGLKLLVDNLIPDVPDALRVRMLREEFIVEHNTAKAADAADKADKRKASAARGA